MTLDGTQTIPAQKYTPRRIIGVGNVGRHPGQATYTLYNPANNQITFKTVKYSKTKGFAVQNS